MPSLISLILFVVLLAVLATFLLRLYEWRNLPSEERDEEGERLAPGLTGFFAVFWEYLTTLFTLLLLPVGWLASDPEGRGATLAREDERPVLFVSGLFGNAGAFWLLKRYLRRHGHISLYGMKVGSADDDIAHFAERLGERIEDIRAVTGAGQVDLICHGIGGLAGRLYVLRGGVGVAHLVTIGTPHRGSRLGPLLGGRANRDVRPGSPLLQELEELQARKEPAGSQVVNLYSPFDNVVLPNRLAVLPGADNRRIDYLGHTALLYSPQVHRICRSVIDAPAAAAKPHHYYSEFPNE